MKCFVFTEILSVLEWFKSVAHWLTQNFQHWRNKAQNTHKLESTNVNIAETAVNSYFPCYVIKECHHNPHFFGSVKSYFVTVNTKTQTHYGGIPLSDGTYDFTAVSAKIAFWKGYNYKYKYAKQFNFCFTFVSSVIPPPPLPLWLQIISAYNKLNNRFFLNDSRIICKVLVVKGVNCMSYPKWPMRCEWMSEEL